MQKDIATKFDGGIFLLWNCWNLWLLIAENGFFWYEASIFRLFIRNFWYYTHQSRKSQAWNKETDFFKKKFNSVGLIVLYWVFYFFSVFYKAQLKP